MRGQAIKGTSNNLKVYSSSFEHTQLIKILFSRFMGLGLKHCALRLG